ncbi:MAG: nuclear transport factor 2 family protein, partial [Cyclobacteriaceae bacterium]|nr:nuclear transport factor 2 family protein [Cyclobacteriaceae bacterium]
MEIQSRIILFLILLGSCTPAETPDQNITDADHIGDIILRKGRLVEWAFNHGRMDTVLADFWKSDSATFILNGRLLEGYSSIMNRFEQANRNKIEIEITKDKVVVLSPASAIHIASFDQRVEDSPDQIINFKGTWTTVYQKINNDWKVVNVHESF